MVAEAIRIVFEEIKPTRSTTPSNRRKYRFKKLVKKSRDQKKKKMNFIYASGSNYESDLNSALSVMPINHKEVQILQSLLTH